MAARIFTSSSDDWAPGHRRNRDARGDDQHRNHDARGDDQHRNRDARGDDARGQRSW